MKVENIKYIKESELIKEFEEITGWSSDKWGEWNSDKSKYCFEIERDENSLQYEQDWISDYYPSNYDHVTSDKNSLIKDSNIISIGEMLQYFIKIGEIEPCEQFLVGTKSY